MAENLKIAIYISAELEATRSSHRRFIIHLISLARFPGDQLINTLELMKGRLVGSNLI